VVAWGRALPSALLQHPSMPLIFLSQAVIGQGVFQGIEALVGALARAGAPPADGVRAVYVVVIYATGFVAWELPRTREGSRSPRMPPPGDVSCRTGSASIPDHASHPGGAAARRG
jgi:Tetracyclin repressor-like, C-terminal domain